MTTLLQQWVTDSSIRTPRSWDGARVAAVHRLSPQALGEPKGSAILERVS